LKIAQSLLNHGMTSRHLIIIIYVLIASVILLRIISVDNLYQTYDSYFYLRMSENISLLKGPLTPEKYPFEKGMEESYNAIWPPGYPVLISLSKLLFNFNGIIASKILNFISLGLILRIFYLWMGDKSVWIACFFTSYSMLDIYSHTWSEGVFITSLVWLIYLLDLENNSVKNSLQQTYIFISLILLVSTRYAGLVIILFVTFYLLYLVFTKRHERAKYLFFPYILAVIFSILLLSINFMKSGGFFGDFSRVEIGAVTWNSFIRSSSISLLNELLFIRNFNYTHYNPLFFFSLVIQLIFLFLLVKYTTFKRSGSNYLLFFCGLFYLVFMLILSKISPIYTLYYRLLAPFSILFYSWIISCLETKKRISQKKITGLICAFGLISLGMNLPKKYLMNLIF